MVGLHLSSCATRKTGLTLKYQAQLLLRREKGTIAIIKARRAKKRRNHRGWRLWLSVLSLCLLTIGQSVTAAGITPTYQTTPTGMSPTHAWSIPGQADVINPQGGHEHEGWDNVTQWDGAPDNTHNAYLKFGGHDVNNPAYQIRQYARQTATPGLFDVFLNVKGNRQVTIKPIDIVLVTDMSGSMNSVFNGGIKREYAMREGIEKFMQTINDAGYGDFVNVGLVAFAAKESDKEPGIWSENIDRVSNATHVSTINKILRNPPVGGTFTQNGLREAQNMLASDASDHKKIMVLLTDGLPTQSYKVTQAKVVDGHVIGTGFSQAWDYPGHTSQFIESHYPDWIERPAPYQVDGQMIPDTWAATLGEAYALREKGTELHTLGIQLDMDSWGTGNNSHMYLTKTQVRERMALLATPGHYQDANTLDDVGTYLAGQVNSVLSEFYTVKNGTVHNPIGEQFIYADTPPTVTSVGKKVVDNLPSVTRDAKQVTVNNLNLGQNQEIQVHYQVHLKTEDRNFQPDFWYQMSGPTTLTPTEKSDAVAFGVPSAKAAGTKLQVTKKWVDDIDRTKRPDQIQFGIGRKVANQLTEWRAVGQLTAAENWQKTVTQGMQDGQSVWLPAYNNQGQAFDYHVLNEQTAGYVTHITQQDNQATVTNCQYGLIIDKIAQGTTLLLKGATFTVSSSDGQQVMTVQAGQCQLLTPGDYTIQETQSPSGFQMANTTYHLTLTADGQWLSDGQAITATVPESDGDGVKDGFSIDQTLSHNASQTNVVKLTQNNPIKPFKLVVKKTDAQTTLPVSGAKFELKALTDETLTLKANRNGTAFTVTHLTPGTYTLTERQAPQGYLPAEPVVIVISPDGRVQVTGGTKQWATKLTNGQTDNQVTLQVPNRNQAVLPNTGGAGQLPYVMVAGGVLSVGLLLNLGYQYGQRRRQKK